MSINFKDMAKSIVDNYADLMLPSTDRLDELEFMILQGFLAIKDELMRAMPEEMKWDIGYQHQDCVDAEQRGHNTCRSQMISAIEEMMK